MTITEKISEAIDKLYKAEFYKPSLQICKIVVVVGVNKLEELKAEAYSLVLFNFPSPKYTFQGCEVIVDYLPTHGNEAAVELRDNLTGKVKKRIKIKSERGITHEDKQP